MKKAIGKMITFVLASAFALGSLVGCTPKVPDTPETLEIYIQELGYGIEWLNKEIELFKNEQWVKDKYPNLNIPTPSHNAQYGYGAGQIEAGAKANSADLIFTSAEYDLQSKTDSKGERYIEDLTEGVFNKTVPGESVLYKDKMIDAFEETSVYDGHYWSTLWSCQYQGFLYNQTKFTELELEVPNTTDELLALCATVKTKGYNSFFDAAGAAKKTYSIMYSTKRSEAAYWQYMAFPIWWAQYEGMTEYENFYKGIDTSSGIAATDSSAVLSQTGRKESMNVVHDLLSQYGFTDAGSIDFMQSQDRFLAGDGLLMANGDWLYEEMKTTVAGYKALGCDYDIRFMKNPVISSIVDNLPDGSVSNDAELSALIDAIDLGSTALTGTGYEVTQNDFDRVKAARNLSSTEYLNQAFVPSYATAKEVAKDFLLFLATDKAIEAYMQATRGATLPFKYDVATENPTLYNTFDGIQKYRETIFQANPTFLPSTRRQDFELAYLGGLKAVPTGLMDAEFLTGTSAQDFFKAQVDFYGASQWDTVLRNAGRK